MLLSASAGISEHWVAGREWKNTINWRREMKGIGKSGLVVAIFFSLALLSCGDLSQEPSDQESAEQIGTEDFDSVISAQTSVNTKIKSKPPAATSSTTATFKFSCTAGRCAYKCQMDANPWAKCKSPIIYTTLALGDHTFKVRAYASGKSDRSPAKYTWHIGEPWVLTTLADAPLARIGHTSVWTGTEMIVWGGYYYDTVTNYLQSGARYNPVTDSWSATSLTNAPEARSNHTAVWAKTEMVVWGGGANTVFNTGARYNPATNSWTPTETTNAASARKYQSAVWTGTRMIVWGGYDGSYTNSGGSYNPVTNSWTAISSDNAPVGRRYHSAVWAGTQMIVWGGYDGANIINTGGRYTPKTNSWALTSTGANVPSARQYHAAVWTGTEMIIWGGDNSSSCFDTGGRYNPSSNSWTATTQTNAPVPRTQHTALWIPNGMLIWGGYYWTSTNNYLNSGSVYNPLTDSWAAIPDAGAPPPRNQHTAVWTGSQMIVWGGYRSSTARYFNTGGRYNPTTNSWTATSTINAPSARRTPTSVWTGTEMIVWGGNDGTYANTGAKYNPAADSWTPTSTTNAPLGRTINTAVWTGTYMIVWGGYWYDGVDHYLDSGDRYNPATNSWAGMQTPGFLASRYGHAAVWAATAGQMIVWGGYDDASYFKTGGLYNPGTNAWTQTTTDNAPAERAFVFAVSNGSQMIVWGGKNASYLGDGAIYDPSGNSWSPMPSTNAPSARAYAPSVWTGTEMIVWGGYDGAVYYNSGAKYNLGTNSWTAMSQTNAPAARDYQAAVWAQDRMIIWGGNASGGNLLLSSGGLYDPSGDSWIATSDTNAPEKRYYHTAVWTDTEMIVFGGIGWAYINTGGVYLP